ncbi:MAG: hypothetical protein AB7J28_15460 [Hyphomonadaceae bacterium]
MSHAPGQYIEIVSANGRRRGIHVNAIASWEESEHTADGDTIPTVTITLHSGEKAVAQHETYESVWELVKGCWPSVPMHKHSTKSAEQARLDGKSRVLSTPEALLTTERAAPKSFTGVPFGDARMIDRLDRPPNGQISVPGVNAGETKLPPAATPARQPKPKVAKA